MKKITEVAKPKHRNIFIFKHPFFPRDCSIEMSHPHLQV